MCVRAIKVKIYPNKAQSVLIDKHFGCCRYIYNYALNRKIKEYETTKKSLSIYQIQREITQLKKEKETEWLGEVFAQSLQQTTFDLESAFSSFFKKRSKFPRFKSKHNSKQSYRIPTGFEVSNERRTIKIPKIGWISFKDKFDFKDEYDYRQITVSRNASDNYFVSVLYDDKVKEPTPMKVKFSKTLGIDVGMTTLATLSDGTKVNNPKFYDTYKEELGAAQMVFSRKQKGSNNYWKQKKIVAKKHEKISSCLKDYMHKLSNKLVDNQDYDSFAMEHLDISTMEVKHVNQVGWNMLKNMMAYKCKARGKNLLTIGKYDPSTKTCSKCGSIKEDLKLSDRQWKCPTCNELHDRDVNAANSIKLFAMVRAEPLKL
jgi:putative transposase